jgi:hypothetical protein
VKQTNLLAQVCIGIAGIALILEFWLGLQQWWVCFFLVPMFFWSFSQRKGIRRLASILLTLYTFTAAIGILVNGPPVLALICVLASLSAWDLDSFSRRIWMAADHEMEMTLYRNHMYRLAILNSLGLVLGVAVLFLRSELRLGYALLLGFLAILGLSQIITHLGSQAKS